MSALSGAHLALLTGEEAPPRQWTVFLSRTADKSQRKMDKPLRLVLRDALMRLCMAPERLGERLSQPLTGIFSHHITYQGKEFRIAYKLCPDTETIIVLLIGPHENFYRKLRNLLYAS